MEYHCPKIGAFQFAKRFRQGEDCEEQLLIFIPNGNRGQARPRKTKFQNKNTKVSANSPSSHPGQASILASFTMWTQSTYQSRQAPATLPLQPRYQRPRSPIPRPPPLPPPNGAARPKPGTLGCFICGAGQRQGSPAGPHTSTRPPRWPDSSSFPQPTEGGGTLGCFISCAGRNAPSKTLAAQRSAVSYYNQIDGLKRIIRPTIKQEQF